MEGVDDREGKQQAPTKIQMLAQRVIRQLTKEEMEFCANLRPDHLDARNHYRHATLKSIITKIDEGLKPKP